nr:MAG TPA: hypothetical protein [Caudoviricetes sp.]
MSAGPVSSHSLSSRVSGPSAAGRRAWPPRVRDTTLPPSDMQRGDLGEVAQTLESSPRPMDGSSRSAEPSPIASAVCEAGSGAGPSAGRCG